MAVFSKKAEEISALLPDEPSGTNYFLDKGFSDLGATIRESFTANGKSASKAFKSITGSKYSGAAKAAMGVLYFFSGIAVAAFGTILTLLISVVHSVIVLAIMVFVYIALGIARAVDGLYRHTLGLAVVCDRCKIKTQLPGYKCPNCGKMHYRLKPNVYGVFTHTCECGQKLPAAFFVRTKNKSTGDSYRRAKLDAVCGNPMCKTQVFSGESRPVTIMIAGSPSVGKTAFLTAVTHELLEDALLKAGCEIEHYSPEKETEYKRVVERNFSSGETEKTIESSDRDRPSAFSLSFFVKHGKLRPRRLMHIFDIAGETFIRNTEHERQLQYSYAGVILIVDPMAIPEVRDQHEDELEEADALSIGSQDPNQVLASFVAKVQNVGLVAMGQQSDIPVAVVINKIDQPGVKDAFSDAALAGYRAAHADCAEGDVMDRVCRSFFADNHMGNFVTTLDVNFKVVRYFACSAIGHARGKGRYQPKGVLDPVRWLVSLTDKQLASVMGAQRR